MDQAVPGLKSSARVVAVFVEAGRVGPPLCVRRKPAPRKPARKQGLKTLSTSSSLEGKRGGPPLRSGFCHCFGTMFKMKIFISLISVLILSTVAYSQSGRRAKEITVPVPPPVQETTETEKAKQTVVSERAPTVTAERNQAYRCSDDGTLERILETEDATGNTTTTASERILSSKETDSRVVITAKPPPSYTKEARRNGIQGFVIVKVLLSGNSKVSRVRVVKGLPAGLTENAIRAACKMKFKPALKDGAPVSQWVIAEYAFRLSDSYIFRP